MSDNLSFYDEAVTSRKKYVHQYLWSLQTGIYYKYCKSHNVNFPSNTITSNYDDKGEGEGQGGGKGLGNVF